MDATRIMLRERARAVAVSAQDQLMLTSGYIASAISAFEQAWSLDDYLSDDDLARFCLIYHHKVRSLVNALQNDMAETLEDFAADMKAILSHAQTE